MGSYWADNSDIHSLNDGTGIQRPYRGIHVLERHATGNQRARCCCLKCHEKDTNSALSGTFIAAVAVSLTMEERGKKERKQRGSRAAINASSEGRSYIVFNHVILLIFCCASFCLNYSLDSSWHTPCHHFRFGLLRKNKVNNPICTNIGQLKDRLEQVWHHEEDIPAVVARGIESMPRRIKAVIKLLQFCCCSKRRRFLLDLGQELIKPHVKQRIQKLTGMPAHTITAMKELLGEDASLVTQHSSSMKLLKGTGSVGRCKLCPRNKDRKCKTKCGKCYSFVCSEHAVIKKDKRHLTSVFLVECVIKEEDSNDADF
ncbi:hypothetical protein C0J52_26779 [Blattella germanica]|nr:hypothetical protein C0J52_26779 [Blattella germanica]